LYQRAGRYADGLNYLQEVAPQIVDKTGVQELKAALLLQNGDLEAAQTEYLALLDINSENHNYHEGYQKSLGLYGPGKYSNFLKNF
jgi:Flp pilus assembly protein TadD